MSGYLYMASPYTNADPEVREGRYREAMRVAGLLMLRGDVVFSPIVHSHCISLALNNPVDHEFWMRQCIGMLDRADRLVVLRLPGWRKSKGVALELEYAGAHGIPSEFIDP